MENKKNPDLLYQFEIENCSSRYPDLDYQIETSLSLSPALVCQIGSSPLLSPDVVFVTERSSSSQTISLILLVISCTIAGMIQLLPYRYVSKGLPPIYDGVVISTACAFSGSFCALFLQNKPKLARICVYCSVAAVATVVTLLLCGDRSEMMKDGASYSTD